MNQRIRKTLLTVLFSLVFGGCASSINDSLPQANGTNGAIVIPIDITTNSDSKKFPCRSVELLITKTFREPSELDVSVSKEIFTGSKPTYALITNLSPGEYTVNRYRCHANYRRVFDGGRAYLNRNVSISFEVFADKVVILNRGFRGSVDYDAAGNSSFNHKFNYASFEHKADIKEILLNKGLAPGWVIVNQ